VGEEKPEETFKCAICGKEYHMLPLYIISGEVKVGKGGFYWKCQYCGEKNVISPQEDIVVLKERYYEKLKKVV
jgi:DNA-directed RNA polymerase subunit RPC12/RpoP